MDSGLGDDLRSVLDYYANEVADDPPLQGLSPRLMLARADQGNAHCGMRRRTLRVNRHEERLNSSIEGVRHAPFFLSRSANDSHCDLP